MRTMALSMVSSLRMQATSATVGSLPFSKKGKHSVGVARRYCGVLGKQDNCQVGVSVSLANEQVSLPVAYRLYLPKEWATDAKRRE